MTNKLSGLYGITSQQMLIDNSVLFSKVEQALKGGMSILQYRDKQPRCLQSIEDLKQLKNLCHDYQATFIINDNVSLCQQLNADGVHLGKEDGDIKNARSTLGKDAIIGVSCYGQIELAQNAQVLGANYVAFGAFYSSVSKPEAKAISIDILDAATTLNIPVCCIGGININNAPPLINKGAHMLAIISDLFNHHNVQSNAEKYSQLF